MRKSEDLCFMSYQQPAEDSCKQYQNILINRFHELSLSSLNAESMEDVWKKFLSTLHNAAESSFGKVKSTVGHFTKCRLMSIVARQIVILRSVLRLAALS